MEEKGGSGSGEWGWGGSVVLVLSQKADGPTQHVASDASPLSVPAPSNLCACLCQQRLRSSCSAHSELTDPSSAGKNISLCHPPHPRFELCNLPSLSFSVKFFHSCTTPLPRFTRLLLMYSLRLNLTVVHCFHMAPIFLQLFEVSFWSMSGSCSCIK